MYLFVDASVMLGWFHIVVLLALLEYVQVLVECWTWIFVESLKRSILKPR